MDANSLKEFAEANGISMVTQTQIALEAAENIKNKYGHSVEYIKENFDELIIESEKEAYEIYSKYEAEFGQRVIEKYVEELEKKTNSSESSSLSKVIGKSFTLFDRFFLSLAQGRKARAGKTFEGIHNSLFKELKYPFDEQIVINGKPDFLMPSAKHYKDDPLDCIIFTAKRTLRERWRQIVTEGTRGRGFYLATIDEKISNGQLVEMHNNKIYVVCPKFIKESKYKNMINVLSFEQFFKDHLDPAMERWTRNGII